MLVEVASERMFDLLAGGIICFCSSLERNDQMNILLIL
jgi:hypothetical protein